MVVSGALTAGMANATEPVVDETYRPFADDVASVMRAQTQQLRARQQRLRAQRVRAGQPQASPMPLVSNDLIYAPFQKPAVTLRSRSAGTQTAPGLNPSGIGQTTTFASGTLYSDARENDGAGLCTDALTLGADYRSSATVVAGFATSYTRKVGTLGSSAAAYATFEPLDAVFLDATAALGLYEARGGRFGFQLGGAPHAGATSLSLMLSHQRQVGGWTLTPFSRVEKVDTEVRGNTLTAMPTRQARVVSVGSIARGDVFTPLGRVEPQLTLELQRKMQGYAGSDEVQGSTQRIVGLTLLTQMTRDVAAFAESQLMSLSNADSTSRTVLGLRVVF